MDRLTDVAFSALLDSMFGEWVPWLWGASLLWLFIGARGAPLPDLRSRLIFGGPLCLLAAPWLVFLAVCLIFLVILGAQWLLDPQNFWVALLVVAISWFVFRRSSSSFKM